MITKALFLVPLLVLSACVSMEERQAAVVKRASYDMGCSEDNIKLTNLQNDGKIIKFGAEGCGKKLVYDTKGANVYIEGAAPNEVIVHHNNYINKPTPTPALQPPIGAWKY